MGSRSLQIIAALSALVAPVASEAYAINPTSDGSLYACAGCNVVSNDQYVLVSGYIQGEIKFSSASITGAVSQVLLTVNPYGLPLFGKNVDIYGYGSAKGYLDVTDANSGTYLGTLTLTAALGYGQDAYFDVTTFIQSTQAPYFAFNLRTPGGDTDVFSSLEYNYGHPSQLLVTAAVPEPATLGLLLAGVGILGLRRRAS